MLEKLKNRLLSLSYKHSLAHLSSCLTSLPIIYNILKDQEEGDIFILSNGHAGLAYYVVLEEVYGYDAESMYLNMGIHPEYSVSKKIHCSTGSLGLGLTVGVGYAIADRDRRVSVLISDGETFEGCVWEALNFKGNMGLDNLIVHVNINGFSAYDSVDKDRLTAKLNVFCDDILIHDTSDFRLEGVLENSLKAHYYNLTAEDVKNLMG